MGLFGLKSYRDYKKENLKYSDLTLKDKDKYSSDYDLVKLGFDEMVDEFANLKAENAALKSQLNRIIELLEKR